MAMFPIRVDFLNVLNLTPFDSGFIKKNGKLCKSYEVEIQERFEKLEDEYYNADDAMYPRIICDEAGNEITTGTAGMFEYWDIIRDAYEAA